MFVFGSRIIWLELGIPYKLRHEKFKEYFGEKDFVIENKKDSIAVLIKIINKIQEKMIKRIQVQDTTNTLKSLYKILDECYHFYYREKKTRIELANLNVRGERITDTLEQNRNISRNIIDATNIWIENTVLLHVVKDTAYKDTTFDLDKELLLELYIYGLASQAVSLLSLSKNVNNKELFYGIDITPKKDIPLDILREHPIIYFNTLIAGNQNVLSDIAITPESNATEFGIGFKNQFGVEFLLFLAMIQYFQTYVLYEGKVALTIMDKGDFIKEVESATTTKINANSIIDNFTLTKSNLSNQLRKGENIIWKIGTNKTRHELCPFIYFDDAKILVSYCALEQAKQLWVSIFSNGGMSYSNEKDLLTNSIEKRNKELSDILVRKIREKLQNHYESQFDEIDVRYNRIYGNRHIDYGDFDIMFYSKRTNELFLIEAKYFSDSLNSSSIITDYEKLFDNDGYYDRCRRRYDLVINNPEPLKKFIGIKGKTNTHFLFVSSKPLDIEFQDEDGIVTFLCLSNFEKYLEGKLISDEDDSIVRPVYKL